MSKKNEETTVLPGAEHQHAFHKGDVGHKDVVFWSAAKRHTIANFRPEEKTGGIIDRAEVSLQFAENVFIAKTPEEAEFIRNSRSFGASVRECKDIAEARRFSLEWPFTDILSTYEVVDTVFNC